MLRVVQVLSKKTMDTTETSQSRINSVLTWWEIELMTLGFSIHSSNINFLESCIRHKSSLSRKLEKLFDMPHAWLSGIIPTKYPPTTDNWQPLLSIDWIIILLIPTNFFKKKHGSPNTKRIKFENDPHQTSGHWLTATRLQLLPNHHAEDFVSYCRLQYSDWRS